MAQPSEHIEVVDDAVRFGRVESERPLVKARVTAFRQCPIDLQQLGQKRVIERCNLVVGHDPAPGLASGTPGRGPRASFPIGRTTHPGSNRFERQSVVVMPEYDLAVMIGKPK